MEIPYQKLAPDVLRAVIEEFVSRDGTDYGAVEAGFEAKIAQVMRQLERGDIRLVFDAESETCNLVSPARLEEEVRARDRAASASEEREE